MSKEVSQELLAKVSAHIQRSTVLAEAAKAHPLGTRGHGPMALLDSGQEKTTDFAGAGVIYVRTAGAAKQQEPK